MGLISVIIHLLASNFRAEISRPIVCVLLSLVYQRVKRNKISVDIRIELLNRMTVDQNAQKMLFSSLQNAFLSVLFSVDSQALPTSESCSFNSFSAFTVSLIPFPPHPPSLTGLFLSEASETEELFQTFINFALRTKHYASRGSCRVITS